MDADEYLATRLHWRTMHLPWYPKRGTRNTLANIFGELGFATGVEIGTKDGEYAKILMDCNKSLHLTCVDPWAAYNGISQRRQDEHYRIAMDRLKGYEIRVVRKASVDAVSDFDDESLDFAYIDADHTFDYAVTDILCWSKKVRAGGIVACHDYDNLGVHMAVEAYTRCHDIRPWYITRGLNPTAFWVRR